MPIPLNKVCSKYRSIIDLSVNPTPKTGSSCPDDWRLNEPKSPLETTALKNKPCAHKDSLK